MLESQMYLPPQGFGTSSRSLAGPAHISFPARLALLGYVRVTLTYALTGDQLTWGILEALEVPWGDSDAILYEHCLSGWQYSWDLNSGTFTVTDDSDYATVYPEVNTLSGLGISWGILESRQFSLFKTRDIFIEDSSLVGTRADEPRPSEAAKLHWMISDYLAGVQHAVFDFLAGYRAEPLGVCPVSTSFQSDGSESVLSDILLARADELKFINYYPLNLRAGENHLTGDRQLKQWTGLQQTHSTLMIMCFAARLLSAEARVLYEPWMLYAMFQWLFNRPNVVKKDSIFDLSPWWG
ncbi:MAG TPA: hypothetical protein PKA10_18375 [Selenomonadales bacterium]|nr:hypothetical protein [Selenomonadales bacterium]